MSAPMRILYLEDSLHDAKLVQRTFAREGSPCEWVRVDSRAEFETALDQGAFDLILSDYTLPSYEGRAALKLARSKCPDIPFIFFSGTIGEEAAIEALKAGATDYVLKQRPSRLVAAVRRALDDAKERRERAQAEIALAHATRDLQNIMETVPDIIYRLDSKGRLVRWNRKFEMVTGFSRDELLHRQALAFFLDPDRPIIAEAIRKTLETGYAEVEGRLLTKEGKSIPYHWTGATLRDDAGHVVGLTGVGRDLTERQQLEEQLRQAQKMEAVGRLAGGIAHDFNNLLTVINGYSQLLLTMLISDDPLREYAEQIKLAGKRAATLTRQLLAFSRKQVLDLHVLNLNTVVTNIEPLLRRLIGEDIDSIMSLDPCLGCIRADPGQIEQVIMNLAVNARDAMPKGGRLTIETANSELDEAYARQHVGVQPGPYVMLAVSDTGHGMDAAVKARIFEPFFTTKEQGKGTGLGLAMVYGIVKQSEGHLGVSSEVGQGTTFKIYFPRVEAEAERADGAPVRTEGLGGSETILLVEDQDMVRSLIRTILERHGYTVLEARDGAEALRVCQQYADPIHLMVTDVVMPRMSGRVAADRVTGMRQGIKVLYLSGYTDNAIVHHGVLEPGTAFLQKPFTPDTLARKVREVLDSGKV